MLFDQPRPLQRLLHPRLPLLNDLRLAEFCVGKTEARRAIDNATRTKKTKIVPRKSGIPVAKARNSTMS